MPKLWGRFNRLVVPFLVLLALLALFGIYQRYYVKSQEAYLTGHGFRILAAVGRQVDAYINSVRKTVEAAKGSKAVEADRSSNAVEAAECEEVPAKCYLINYLQRLFP